MLLSAFAPYRVGMRRFLHVALAPVVLCGIAACYRLPLHIRENDASGYEDVGVPVIEAVEYTPAGRDLRVSLEAAGYVTVIVVDPDRGATVRFRRGELRSVFAEKGVHRYPLDKLASPMALTQFMQGPRSSVPARMGRATLRNSLARSNDTFETPMLAAPADSSARELALASRRVAVGSGPVTSAHVVVIVTEQPLNLIGVATRLARGSLDPALIAQSAADVVEGGRWMAAVAPLRGQ